jgi:predicted peptidase
MMQSKQVSIHPWVNGYWEYFPDNWDKVKKLPLIIFFHGIGETFPKKSLQAYSDVGLPLKIKQSGMPQDCVVFMPQLNSNWAGGGTVQAIIDWAVKNYAVDTNRIYLTGPSMGGGSIMDFADQGRVQEIAAMLPICPASWFNTAFAQKYFDAGTPIRFYHSEDDSVVSPASSKSWTDSLNKLGIKPQVTRVSLNGYGHNCWDYVYNEKAAWDWLFSQSRSNKKTVEAEFQFPGGKYTLFSDGTWLK